MNTNPNSLQVISVDAFSRSSPVRDRENEDAWFFIDSPRFPESVFFAVIDGASVRKSLPGFDEKIKTKFPRLTPAGFASYLLKTSLEQQFKNEPACSLRVALLRANDLLRTEITNFFGTFNAEQIVRMLDLPFTRDPHNVRLVLPTCVVTLARLDLAHARLEFAHLGDTALFEMFHNGDIYRHTRDQMGPFDLQALESIRTMQQRLQIEHFKDAVSSPEGREFIIESGLRLNYVDRTGKTNPRQGCGVVNGLFEMEDYVETDVVDVDRNKTLGFFILSDGIELLSPLQEDLIQRQQRYKKTGEIIRHAGLRGLYNEMEHMVSSDNYLDIYPRTKLQDDATGIYLEIG